MSAESIVRWRKAADGTYQYADELNPLPVADTFAALPARSLATPIGKSTNTSLSNTTGETTIIAAVAAKYHDVYALHFANTGASATEVSIRDDTGGTVRDTIEVPAGETRGWQAPINQGMFQTAANKNWTAQCATATTALKVTAFYTENS